MNFLKSFVSATAWWDKNKNNFYCPNSSIFANDKRKYFFVRGNGGEFPFKGVFFPYYKIWGIFVNFPPHHTHTHNST